VLVALRVYLKLVLLVARHLSVPIALLLEALGGTTDKVQAQPGGLGL
jgi:hypothetical protein